MQVLLGLFILLSILSRITSELLEYHSFEPPFTEIDTISGNRLVPNWRTAGTTVVNTNFIRITPDRQSKKGALWSRKAIDTPSMSSVFKFRISGQGKNFYGDGIALWIVQSSYYTEGDLHGFQEKFKGIGIIFDTFKNIETVNVHRDVTVLVNDGEKSWAMMTEDVQGCNINVRYHADRADFSVEDASKAKITIDGNNFQLMVDARDTGEWVECVNLKNLPLPTDWLKDAHIGITATTGQLADNHDVLSLVTYSDAHILDQKEAEKAAKKLYESNPDAPIPDRLLKLEEAMNLVFEKQDYFSHHTEHEFASISDHIDTVTTKLKKREDSADIRIENLEDEIKKHVDGSIGSRLSKLEQQLKFQGPDVISNNKKKGSNSQKLSIDNETVTTKCNCSSWPFYLSILANIGVCGFCYYIFNMAKKRHLL